MGFATVATAAVLLIATFHVVGVTVPELDAANLELDRAQDRLWERQQLRDTTEATIASVSVGATALIEVENVGSEVVDASAVLVLRDGYPGDALAWTVDGVTTNIWAPGQTAIFEVNPAAGGLYAIVLPTGDLAYWST